MYVCIQSTFFLVIRFHHRMQIWHTINAKYIYILSPMFACKAHRCEKIYTQ